MARPAHSVWPRKVATFEDPGVFPHVEQESRRAVLELVKFSLDRAATSA